MRTAAIVAVAVAVSWLLAAAVLAFAGPVVVIFGDSGRLVKCTEDVDVPDGNGTVIRIPSGQKNTQRQP